MGMVKALKQPMCKIRFLSVISNKNLLFVLNIKYNSITFSINQRGGLPK